MFDFRTVRVILNYVIFRVCENCDQPFLSKVGLEQHLTRQRTEACGFYAKIKKRRKKMEFFHNRWKLIKEERKEKEKEARTGPIESLGYLGKVYGPLSTKEKELILRIVRFNIEGKGYKRLKVSLYVENFNSLAKKCFSTVVCNNC